MTCVWQMWTLALLVAILAVLLTSWFRRPGPGNDAVAGTLLITGVSPRPNDIGEQYVTITGVIHGPTVSEYETYQQIAVDVDNWPTVGELIPVRYSPRNPDNWRMVPPESAG